MIIFINTVLSLLGVSSQITMSTRLLFHAVLMPKVGKYDTCFSERIWFGSPRDSNHFLGEESKDLQKVDSSNIFFVRTKAL